MLSVRAGKWMDERPCHNHSETKVFTPTAGKTARLGSGVWFRHGSGLVQVRFGSGLGLVGVWFRFGSGMVHVCFRCGPLRRLSREDERFFTFHWLLGHGSTEACIRSRAQGLWLQVVASSSRHVEFMDSGGRPRWRHVA